MEAFSIKINKKQQQQKAPNTLHELQFQQPQRSAAGITAPLFVPKQCAVTFSHPCDAMTRKSLQIYLFITEMGASHFPLNTHHIETLFVSNPTH